jgi:hypothetical protein
MVMDGLTDTVFIARKNMVAVRWSLNLNPWLHAAHPTLGASIYTLYGRVLTVLSNSELWYKDS